MFSWIPFYREVAEKVLEFEERQDELCDLLVAVKDMGLSVYASEGGIEKGIMEPFSFIENFNRLLMRKNIEGLCSFFKTQWNLKAALPSDFEGLPVMNAHTSWGASIWHNSTEKLQDEFIPLLWSLARNAFNSQDAVDSEHFNRCLQIYGVELRNLTTGLYWFNPYDFLPLTKPMMSFLKQNKVTWDDENIRFREPFQEYLKIMQQAKILGSAFPELSQRSLPKGNIAPEPMSNPAKMFLLNTILYGPPGTGKTFSTFAKAVAISDGTAPNDHAACVERFQDLREAGRIEFVTFHQSFAYEEFIEVLRPVIDENAKNGARYEVRDGILKRIARVAQLGEVDELPHDEFESLWVKFKARYDNWGAELSGLRSTTKHKINFKGDTVRSDKQYSATKEEIQMVYEQFPTPMAVDRHFIIGKFNEFKETLITAIVHELRHLAEEKSPVHRAEPLPHVLIIDEINRGNISKIFGELITLLEPDKRLGGENPLRVTLPYSQESFGLPSNLFVLGTMNTADKSLALLDVALRRRFVFQEIKPDFSVCPTLAPQMRAVLETLNRRLMVVLDREHRLGHAFFMKVGDNRAEFNRVFRESIVPLLQEFFYNDWKGLRDVLGEKGDGKIVGEMTKIEGIGGRIQFAWWDDLDKNEPDFLAELAQNYGL